MKAELSKQDGCLAERIDRTFRENVTHRNISGADAMLLGALTAWAKVPTTEDVAFFKSMGVLPKTFDSITRVKLLQIIAVLGRVFGNPGDKSWGVDATPYPTIPEEEEVKLVLPHLIEGMQLAKALNVLGDAEKAGAIAASALKANEETILAGRREYARKRAERMELVIDDILMESGYNSRVIRAFLMNITKLGTSVIIGPEPVPTMVLKPKSVKGGVVYQPAVEMKLRFSVPNTMDVYPSPGMTGADDGELCVRVKYSRAELARAMANPAGGWRRDALKAVLACHPDSGVDDVAGKTLTDMVQRVAQLEGVQGSTKKFEGVRWFGVAQGSELAKYGVKDPMYDDGRITPDSWYEATTIVIGGQVVYAAVCDQMVGRPLVKASFYNDATSQFFGFPPSSNIDGCQTLMNVVMSALKKQLQLKGLVPVVVNNYSEFVDADKPGAFALTPGKVMLRRGSAFAQQSGQTPPVQPVDVPSIIREAMAMIEVVWKLCDDLSGFNRNMLGSGNYSGAARTAQGLETIMSASSTMAQDVISGIDASAIEPLLCKVAAWVNRYFPDNSVKGDVCIIPKGQVSRILKSTRQQQVMAGFNMANSGAMPQLLGAKTLVKMFGDALKSVEYPGANSIVPDDERLEFLQQIEDGMKAAEMVAAGANAAQQGGGQPQPGGGQPEGAFRGRGGARQAQPQQAAKEAGMLPPSGVEDRRAAG